MSVTFEEIVRAWLLHYDDRLPNNRVAKREAFMVLLGNLAEHGFGKDDLNISKRDKIIKSCVNLNHKNKSKLRKWVSITLNDLEAAILIYYPVVKIREDVVTPEMKAKNEGMGQKAEESKKLKTSKDGNDDENEEESNLEDMLSDDVVLTPKKSKDDTFEITDDILGEDTGPEITYDKDFLKRLGLE